MVLLFSSGHKLLVIIFVIPEEESQFTLEISTHVIYILVTAKDNFLISVYNGTISAFSQTLNDVVIKDVITRRSGRMV